MTGRVEAHRIDIPTMGLAVGIYISFGLLTWFHNATGTEISVLPGILFNTTNPATGYHTGTEFHMDFMLNQFVMPSVAIGAGSAMRSISAAPRPWIA